MSSRRSSSKRVRTRSDASHGAVSRSSQPPRISGFVTLPSGTKATRFTVAGEELAILSFPVLEPELPEDVTQAERDVVRLVILGKSNAEIARERGTSIRTVANQMQSIFKKLGVFSRAELIARLSG